MGTYVPISLVFMALYEKKVPIIISAIVLALKLNRGVVSLLSIIENTPQTTPDEGLVPSLDDFQSYRVHLLGSGHQQQDTDWQIRCIQHLLNWMLAKEIEELDARAPHQFLKHDGDRSGRCGFTYDLGRADQAINRYLRFLVETGRTQVPLEITFGGSVIKAFRQKFLIDILLQYLQLVNWLQKSAFS